MMMHFWGTTISVTANPNEYKALNRKAKKARREIELEKHGKFAQEWVDAKDSKGKPVHTRRQIFVPDQATEVKHANEGHAQASITVAPVTTQ